MKGAILGLDEVMTNKTEYMNTVICNKDSVFLTIDKDDFMQKLSTQYELDQAF